MGTLTIAGHRFERVQVDGTRLAAELQRMSREGRSTRVFVRKADGCVLTEVPLGGTPGPGFDAEGVTYLILAEERTA
jgi:hypothetical protein